MVLVFGNIVNSYTWSWAPLFQLLLKCSIFHHGLSVLIKEDSMCSETYLIICLSLLWYSIIYNTRTIINSANWIVPRCLRVRIDVSISTNLEICSSFRNYLMMMASDANGLKTPSTALTIFLTSLRNLEFGKSWWCFPIEDWISPSVAAPNSASKRRNSGL